MARANEGYERFDTQDRPTRSSVMFVVNSERRLFDALKKGRERIIQGSPVQMQDDVYWLQFADPYGNIVKVIGER